MKVFSRLNLIIKAAVKAMNKALKSSTNAYILDDNIKINAKIDKFQKCVNDMKKKLEE